MKGREPMPQIKWQRSADDSGLLDNKDDNSWCPVELNLVLPHLGDLRRTTLTETPFSNSSH
jgi:hypothetical protein